MTNILPRPMFFALLTCALPLAIAPQIAQSQEIVRPAKVAVVQSTDGTLERRYPALVEASQEAEISFRVSGRIIELPARGALEVKAGDVLAKLDPRDFEKNIAQLESQRDQSLAQLKALKAGARSEEIAALQASVDAAQAQVDQARDKLERTTQLFSQQVVAQAAVDADEASLRVAEAQLRAQLEQLEIGRVGGRAEDVEAAEAALRGLENQIAAAKDNLSDTTLRAPFDGLVARRQVDNFTNIQAGQTILVLQALDVVDLVFDIPGPDVTAFTSSRDSKPPKTQARFDALPGQIFDSEVTEFSTLADVGTQTYRASVRVKIPERAAILPGMVGEVIASANNGKKTSVSAPLTAVSSAADGTPFVWLVDTSSNTVSMQVVELGEVKGAEVEITKGLEVGATIVTAGVSQIQDGMKIRPITKVGS